MELNEIYPKGYMELPLTVMNEDYLKFVETWDKIEYAIKKKKSVSYKHFQTFIDCWSKKPELEELQNNKEFDSLVSQLPGKIDKAIERFSRHKSYIFAGKYIVKGFVPPALPGTTYTQHKYTLSYNLDVLLADCATEYYRYGNSFKTKEETIRWFYDILNSRISNYKFRHQKQLTKYIRIVLAAYMTHNFTEWQLIDPSKRNNYSNEDLYQAAKNAFRPKKKNAK